MYPPVNPIIVQLGPFALRWYGLLIVLGVLAGGQIAARYVKRHRQDPETVWDLLVWILVPALVGARLYYVFIQSPRGPEGLGRFLADPALIFQIWTGGLHIYGAFIFGAIALFVFVRRRKLPLLIYLDAIGLALPLTQAIGRQANFINQELYGPPTTLPWGLRIDEQHRIDPYRDMAKYPDSTRFQPLFLYESLWNLIGFGLIFWISRRYEKQLRDGDIILMYLIWYPLGRSLIEFFRTDSWFFPGTPFNVVHVLSAIAIVASAITFYRRHRGTSGRGRASGESVEVNPTAVESVESVEVVEDQEPHTENREPRPSQG